MATHSHEYPSRIPRKVDFPKPRDPKARMRALTRVHIRVRTLTYVASLFVLPSSRPDFCKLLPLGSAIDAASLKPSRRCYCWSLLCKSPVTVGLLLVTVVLWLVTIMQVTGHRRATFGSQHSSWSLLLLTLNVLAGHRCCRHSCCCWSPLLLIVVAIVQPFPGLLLVLKTSNHTLGCRYTIYKLREVRSF
ncbi:hypothetical protein CRG98_018328 [Punica granatum]|uniref:Uncharacterized protein n=1 Tax=Punica granatum TaxID=22663 RepID=A0A2I0JY51_PUNGR|nr:hypothetical protein CRG98_018328 [Punica granatum]